MNTDEIPQRGAPIQKLRAALVQALDALDGVIAAPGSYESITRLKNRLDTLRAESDLVAEQIRAARERVSYDGLLKLSNIDEFVADVRAWTPDGVRDIAMAIADNARTARNLHGQYLAADWRALTELCNALDYAERAYTAARLLTEKLRTYVQSAASQNLPRSLPGYLCRVGHNGPEIVPPKINYLPALVPVDEKKNDD